ncbi:hypothetical protein BaRGS_00021612 [Batillaria attramentaria]|uniref:Uncharacterized protein n=1 Tax=Batillaria attramentaria TaxID=370345 RepID=A0ABD0KJE8_9CAEN
MPSYTPQVHVWNVSGGTVGRPPACQHVTGFEFQHWARANTVSQGDGPTPGAVSPGRTPGWLWGGDGSDRLIGSFSGVAIKIDWRIN